MPSKNLAEIIALCSQENQNCTFNVNETIIDVNLISEIKGEIKGEIKKLKITIYHIHWCGFCKQALKKWIRYEKQYTNKPVEFIKVDCKTTECNVGAFPTIKFEYNDKNEEIQGMPPDDEFTNKIDEILKTLS